MKPPPAPPMHQGAQNLSINSGDIRRPNGDSVMEEDDMEEDVPLHSSPHGDAGYQGDGSHSDGGHGNHGAEVITLQRRPL